MVVECSVAAPTDVENHYVRDTLRYFCDLPEQGIGPGTGLIVFIGGYGMTADDAYAAKLRPYLANTYNCVCLTVDYCGEMLFGPKARWVAGQSFLDAIAAVYDARVQVPPGADPSLLLRMILEQFRQAGITTLDTRCVATVLGEGYHSFGLLPALDHLQVVWEVLGRHRLDLGRLYVLGTSYGGYIANLMVKLAPNTFRLVIDNSGFSCVDDDIQALSGLMRGTVSGVTVLGRSERHWNERHFGAAQRAVRSLLLRDQIAPSQTQLYCYHFAEDRVAPTARKRQLVLTYAGKIPYRQRIITAAEIDGRVFKAPSHGMGASMRGLFALAYGDYMASGAVGGGTDFQRGTRRTLHCDGQSYEFAFSVENGVTPVLHRS